MSLRMITWSGCEKTHHGWIVLLKQSRHFVYLPGAFHSRTGCWLPRNGAQCRGRFSGHFSRPSNVALPAYLGT